MNGATWPLQSKACVKEAGRVGGGVAEVAGAAFHLLFCALASAPSSVALLAAATLA